MKANFDQSFQWVIAHEGGYVNDPADPGGPTNLGVTLASWQAYVGHPVTALDIEALTLDAVKPFYKSQVWDLVKGDELASGIDYAVFDCAVNSGPSRAIRLLQSICNVVPDGIIGPETIRSVGSRNVLNLIDEYCQERLNYLRTLSTWARFGNGWTNRVNDVEAKARGLAVPTLP